LIAVSDAERETSASTTSWRRAITIKLPPANIGETPIQHGSSKLQRQLQQNPMDHGVLSLRIRNLLRKCTSVN